MSQTTATRTSPFLHRKVLAMNAPGEVLLTCSHAHCEFRALIPTGPTGAANIFATFNGHLRDVTAAR